MATKFTARKPSTPNVQDQKPPASIPADPPPYLSVTLNEQAIADAVHNPATSAPGVALREIREKTARCVYSIKTEPHVSLTLSYSRA